MAKGPPESEIHVLGIVGSLREGSWNRALLRAARELSPDGMVVTIYEGLGDIPPYNADLEAKGDPASVDKFKNAIRKADALLIATPEYNYGVPGVLKNALDWASRPPAASVLRGKPAAIMGASGGPGATIRAQLALRQTFLTTETYALLKPEVLVARAQEKFDSHGRLTDETTRKMVQQLLEGLALWSRRLSGD